MHRQILARLLAFLSAFAALSVLLLFSYRGAPQRAGSRGTELVSAGPAYAREPLWLASHRPPPMPPLDRTAPPVESAAAERAGSGPVELRRSPRARQDWVKAILAADRADGAQGSAGGENGSPPTAGEPARTDRSLDAVGSYDKPDLPAPSGPDESLELLWPVAVPSEARALRRLPRLDDAAASGLDKDAERPMAPPDRHRAAGRPLDCESPDAQGGAMPSLAPPSTRWDEGSRCGREAASVSETGSNRLVEPDPSEQSPEADPDALQPPTTEGRRQPTGRARCDRAMAVVTQRASEIVRHGFSLASRSAVYSARAEFIAALRSIAEALDAQLGGQSHSHSLDAGLRALREADDFVPRRADASVDVARIVEAHQTPILRDGADRPCSPLVARQRYYTYAQIKLAEACGRNPAASRALYGLGKLYCSRSLASHDPLLISGAKAVVFHRAALAVDPRNYLAANELGVLLARYGELEDARQTLLHGLIIARLPEAWYNLSVVHERLGEHDLARRARYEWQRALRRRSEQPASAAGNEGAPIRWLDPATFSHTYPGPMPQATQAKTQPPQGVKKAGRPWWLPWK